MLLSRIEDEHQHAIQFHRDHNSQLQSITDSAGRRLHIQRNTQGQISAVVHQDAQSQAEHKLVAYEYSSDNDLITITDARGNSAYFRYQNHLIIEETHRDGFRYFFEWNNVRLGRHAHCTHTWGGNRENPRHYRHLKYYPEQRITQVTDGRNTTMTYKYNELGLVYRETLPNGQKLGTSYDHDGLVLFKETGLGNEAMEYDPLGRLISHITIDDQETRYDYTTPTVSAKDHSYNNVSALTLPDGGIHLYQYDNKGALSRHTDPEGRQTSYLRDAQTGFIEAIRSTKGEWQRYHWDSQGQISRIQHPQGGQQYFAYNNLGQLVQEQQDQLSVDYRYDANHNLISQKRNDGQEQHWQYNADDQVTAHTLKAPGTAATTTLWEYEGSAVIRRTNADGTVFDYQYDSEYNLTALINERGEHYQLEYDENERLVGEVGFDGRTQRYHYNAEGQLTHWQEYGRAAHYSRDRENRVIAIQYYHPERDKQPESLSDKAIDQALAENGLFAPTTQEQDNFFPPGTFAAEQEAQEAGQNSGLFDPAATSNAVFRYDANGRLIRAVNGHRDLQFEYNLAGDLIKEQQDDHIIEHSYDNTGNKASTTLPDGRQLAFQYDQHHQLQAVDLGKQTLLSYRYDQFGREQQRQCGELRLDHDYDPMGRLRRQSAYKTTLKHSGAKIAFQQRDYHYNAYDQLTECNDILRGSKRYHYSQRQQLIGLSNDRGQLQESFTFDPAGQLIDRQSVDEPNDIWQAHLPKENTQPSLLDGRLNRMGDRLYHYDNSGNRTHQWRGKDRAISTQYYYNPANELQSIAEDKGNWHYHLDFSYDALGRRIQKNVKVQHREGEAVKRWSPFFEQLNPIYN